MTTFEYTTKYHAIVEAFDNEGITISDLPIALSSDEAEDLAIGLNRAAQWLRMVGAGLVRAEHQDWFPIETHDPSDELVWLFRSSDSSVEGPTRIVNQDRAWTHWAPCEPPMGRVLP